MNLATVILTHNNPELTADTVKSVQAWVGDRVLVLVDQVGWPYFQSFEIKSAKVEEGFRHAYSRSPYRNYALGMKKLYDYWPDSDWFLYLEYDCLFASNDFLEDLNKPKIATPGWLGPTFAVSILSSHYWGRFLNKVQLRIRIISWGVVNFCTTSF